MMEKKYKLTESINLFKCKGSPGHANYRQERPDGRPAVKWRSGTGTNTVEPFTAGFFQMFDFI